MKLNLNNNMYRKAFSLECLYKKFLTFNFKGERDMKLSKLVLKYLAPKKAITAVTMELKKSIKKPFVIPKTIPAAIVKIKLGKPNKTRVT